MIHTKISRGRATATHGAAAAAAAAAARKSIFSSPDLVLACTWTDEVKTANTFKFTYQYDLEYNLHLTYYLFFKRILYLRRQCHDTGKMWKFKSHVEHSYDTCMLYRNGGAKHRARGIE